MQGRPFSKYTSSVALGSYIILLKEYGWDIWRKLNIRYAFQMPVVTGSDMHKMNVFTRLFCEEVKTNVAPYFQWFSYNLTRETLSNCQRFPRMKKNLLERYDPSFRLPKLFRDQGNCEMGWIPFKESCFFLSEAEADWYDADEACEEAGGHLASCMSSQEASFLQDVIKSMPGNKTQYYIGIDTK